MEDLELPNPRNLKGLKWLGDFRVGPLTWKEPKTSKRFLKQ